MDQTLTDVLANGKSSDRFADIIENMSIGYLAILLALAGLGSAWRGADRTLHRTWQPPEFVGQWIQLAAGIVWIVLLVMASLNALVAGIKTIHAWLLAEIENVKFRKSWK
jgi:hypothetical protein